MSDLDEISRLNVGKVIAMKSFTATFGNKRDGEVQLSYRKPKGQRYVFVLLGVEDENGDKPVEVDEVLHRLGWRFEG